MAEDSARREADRRSISIEEVWSEWAADYPAGRVVTPEEVAKHDRVLGQRPLERHQR